MSDVAIVRIIRPSNSEIWLDYAIYILIPFMSFIVYSVLIILKYR